MLSDSVHHKARLRATTDIASKRSPRHIQFLLSLVTNAFRGRAVNPSPIREGSSSPVAFRKGTATAAQQNPVAAKI